MELTYPAYYPDFTCTADRCRDNCCRTGWEIDVDAATVDYYRTLPAPQRQRIFAGLREDEEGCFTICPVEGQCPFLTDRGLCSLVLELGEEHIGDICALHPRYREWFPGRMEIGVGLCCEEAARLILSDPAPAAFETLLTDADPDDEEEEDAPLYLPLLEQRERLLSLLQDRTVPLNLRLARALRLAHALQEQINRGEIPRTDTPLSDIPAGDGSGVLEAALALHGEMEVLEQAWAEDIQDARAHRPDWAGFAAALGERVYEYEHLAVYLLFRYFLKAVWDENVLVKLEQCVLMVLTMAALGARVWARTGQFTLSEQIEVTRQYSKEVEYSDDNMELLAEGFLFEPALSLPALLGALERPCDCTHRAV